VATAATSKNLYQLYQLTRRRRFCVPAVVELMSCNAETGQSRNQCTGEPIAGYDALGLIEPTPERLISQGSLANIVRCLEHMDAQNLLPAKAVAEKASTQLGVRKAFPEDRHFFRDCHRSDKRPRCRWHLPTVGAFRDDASFQRRYSVRSLEYPRNRHQDEVRRRRIFPASPKVYFFRGSF